MAEIHVLSPHVADLIAAGEVVERPASAVKELLENSFDAGAGTVVVEIRSGGRELIRVTDDGRGMSPEDAGVCFLRHATSKLTDEHGLEAIGTLGFRGEALAAISSVSRITLLTRARGSDMGVRVDVAAGEIESMEETGCPEGTSLLVRDLFYNTPARQKFLGSDRAEGSACVQAALRSALGRPEISVRCLKDGKEEFFSPGDGQAASAVYSLLGRDFASGLRELSYDGEEVSVRGFVSAPEACRGNRGAQYFFCNGRPIRSRALQAALEQAYANTAMVGKFPACVLYVTLANGLVDVNVHPTKAEVRFAREKPVFDAVYYGALDALGKAAPELPKDDVDDFARDKAPARPAQGGGSGRPVPRQDFFRRMDAAEYRRRISQNGPAKAEPAAGAARRPVLRENVPYREPARPSGAPAPKPAPEPAAPPAEQLVLDPAFAGEPVRFVGEIMGVYILLERAGELLVIDKHAAHERILFDKMRLNDRPLMQQDLLESVVFTPAPEAFDVLEANLPLFTRLGFALEPFGDGSFIVRGVPADVDPASAVPLLEELAEKLREGRSLSAADVWERLAATVACKAAIKANTSVTDEELLSLAERVLAGEVTHCPHGRPVMTVITRAELDKRFGRIV